MRKRPGKARQTFETGLKIVRETKVPLTGFDRFLDRSQFAGYNLGRYQMAVELAIRKAMGEPITLPPPS